MGTVAYHLTNLRAEGAGAKGSKALVVRGRRARTPVVEVVPNVRPPQGPLGEAMQDLAKARRLSYTQADSEGRELNLVELCVARAALLALGPDPELRGRRRIRDEDEEA